MAAICLGLNVLTHWGLMRHTSAWDLNHHQINNDLNTCSIPNHCLNQWWHIVNWILRNKLQGMSNQNRNISFMKIHLKMSSTNFLPLVQGRCVNSVRPGDNQNSHRISLADKSTVININCSTKKNKTFYSNFITLWFKGILLFLIPGNTLESHLHNFSNFVHGQWVKSIIVLCLISNEIGCQDVALFTSNNIRK